MSIELRPASSLSPAERVDLFNAAYADYFIPFRLDEAALDAMTTNFDLDVDASRVALGDGEPVGFGNLGLRGDQAWIGGVGVVPPARRQGIAEALMRALHEEAAARGVTTVWLEVMEQNEAAYRLYEKLGYRRRARGRGVVTSCRGARRLGARGARRPSPRARCTSCAASASRGSARTERSRTSTTFAASRATREPLSFVSRASCSCCRSAGDDAESLLRTLRGHGTVSVLNLPADDPAADSLRALGAPPSVRQREMALDLRPGS